MLVAVVSVLVSVSVGLSVDGNAEMHSVHQVCVSVPHQAISELWSREYLDTFLINKDVKQKEVDEYSLVH